jgi:predicted HTH transcriptional regulator
MSEEGESLCREGGPRIPTDDGLCQTIARKDEPWGIGALCVNSDELEQLIIDAASKGRLTHRHVRELTGLSREESLPLLEHLVASRRLIRQGEKRGTYYVLRPNEVPLTQRQSPEES